MASAAASQVYLPDGVTVQDVKNSMMQWGMPDDECHFVMAARWYSLVKENVYYVNAFKVPYDNGESAGILLFMSTAESSRIYVENMEQLEHEGMITNPHWLYYSVWCFKGMTLMNFADFNNPVYEGHQPFDDFGSMLQESVFSNTPGWRDTFCRIAAGCFFLDSMRKVLAEGIGASTWVELTIGRSWRVYCGLDFYVSVRSTSMRPPKEEAWYILNGSRPHKSREVLGPEDWYRCQDFQAYGQREAIADWYMEI